MGLVFLIIGLIILVIMCYKNYPILIGAVFASLFIIITAGLNPVTEIVGTYAAGVGGYVSSYLFLFIFGSIFGRLVEISGAASSIANTITGKFGARFVVPALFAAGVILTYGGVSVLVAFFTLYPLMVSLFREANLPRRLIPLVYFAGAGTFTNWIPGTPQMQNLICAKTLGTDTMSSMGTGIAAGIFEAVLVSLYLFIVFRKSKRNNEIYVLTENDKNVLDKISNQKTKMPWWLALIPMAALLIVLNVTNLGTEFSLFCGVLAALICYIKYIPWKNIKSDLGEGINSGITALFATGAVVGVGSVVQSTEAFNNLLNTFTTASANISPLLLGLVACIVLCGFCGSGSGGLSLTLPLIHDFLITKGVNLAVFHRMAALAGTTLDSLPHAGGIVMVLNLSGCSHKESYKEICVVTVLIPIITLAFLYGLNMLVYHI